MEFLNFLHDEPAMGWFVLIALLLTVVPAASVLWRRLSRRRPAEAAKRPEGDTKSTRFNNRAELTLLIVGLILLLVLISWAYGTFLG
jgi:uncharacterized membrane protein